jgi:hypothetical protein
MIFRGELPLNLIIYYYYYYFQKEALGNYWATYSLCLDGGILREMMEVYRFNIISFS